MPKEENVAPVVNSEVSTEDFVPKTRLQIYKEANFGDARNIPDKYVIEETEKLIDNEELTTWRQAGLTDNFTTSLCGSSIVLEEQDVVKIDNIVVPLFDPSVTYQTGDLYWKINLDREQNYAGASITSVGVSPSGTKHASVYRITKKCTLHPKTKTELYYSAVSHLFSNREIESFEELIGPIPKTVNEKLTYRECVPRGTVDEITPKTRTQWYRAKALELVEELPSKVEQVALAEDVTVTWTANIDPGYHCDIYEQEEEFSGSENITVVLNGDEIPYIENAIDENVHWTFDNDTKIRVEYVAKGDPPANSVASAYLATEELLIPPKTNIEKYYAYKAGLYEGELPEPKTVDEYYIALECGWQPTVQENDNDVPGNITNPK